MSTLIKPELAEPITASKQLTDYLARGARPREQWAIGAESEKLVVDAATGEAASFTLIEQLLEQISATGDWREIRESGRLLALLGPHSSITLEPGGQIELSGRLCPDIFCCEGDFSSHVRQVRMAAEPLGLMFLGLGVQPYTPLDRIPWLPKTRYGIMGPYMARTGDMGQRMMKQSAGLQVNLDFADERDCLAKLRLGFALSPLLYALFANSPILEGKPSGYLSTRGEIWARTDPDRTGLLLGLFEADAGFATYVEYALDVPMYFIVREGRYLDLTGERFTFRRYLQEGFAGQTAIMSDWDLHLSTLFPEVRLRPQIEFRSADALPQNLTLSVAALLKGLLYDPEALQAAWDLVRPSDMDRFVQTYRQSWVQGLNTPAQQGCLRDLAVEVLSIAREGLRRQRQRVNNGCDEGNFLDPLEEVAASGVTLAERLLAEWSGVRERDLMLLKTHCGFR